MKRTMIPKKLARITICAIRRHHRWCLAFKRLRDGTWYDSVCADCGAWGTTEAHRKFMERLRADLMTIIDFCDAMAQGIDEAYPDIDPLPAAIQQASDIAQVVAGGDGVMSWGSVRWALNRPSEESGGFGPAWPAVRDRMADVLARAEEMAR